MGYGSIVVAGGSDAESDENDDESGDRSDSTTSDAEAKDAAENQALVAKEDEEVSVEQHTCVEKTPVRAVTILDPLRHFPNSNRRLRGASRSYQASEGSLETGSAPLPANTASAAKVRLVATAPMLIMLALGSY